MLTFCCSLISGPLFEQQTCSVSIMLAEMSGQTTSKIV